MTGTVRRTMMAGIVGLVLLWPVVHLGLVATADVDPWEFFGWAMYSKPAVRIQIRVDVERGGETRPLRAMGELRQRVVDFARRRASLGEFAPPTDLVATIFESDGTIDAVVIMLRHVRLGLDSARLLATDEHRRFERPKHAD